MKDDKLNKVENENEKTTLDPNEEDLKKEEET